MSYGGEADIELATLRGRDYPSIKQFSIFSPNSLGRLRALMRLIETSHLRVAALSVADSADCAIIRLVVSQPERCYEVLKMGGYAFWEIDLVVVALPSSDNPLESICTTLLAAEVNIFYCFPLLTNPYGNSALALHVDDAEIAAQVLQQKGFTLLTESDLE